MTLRPIVVAGALANKPGNGGEAWVRMSWVRGLMRLGFDVWFVEELAATSTPPGREIEWFAAVTDRFELGHRAVLVRSSGDGTFVDEGVSADVDLRQLLRECALLVNISGNLRDPELVGLAQKSAYVDLDPGFTQVWATRGVTDLGLDLHDLHFTVGELIGTPACPLPTAGLRWLPCRQPVVLDDWPLLPPADGGRLTTVATWRCGFGPLEWEGISYGLKVHEFRKVADLPRLTTVPFELALDIHDGDEADRRLLAERGWHVRASADVCATTDGFRRYVQASAGEFTVAQAVYANARTGWFSDRTVRYLASGRPAVVQDTGWADDLDIEAGLVTFGDLDGAVRAVNAVWEDVDRHAAAARRLAEDHFAADVVLTRMLALADVSP